MAETFTYIPDWAAAGEITPKVKAAQFGDGYEQRTGDGINFMPRTWQVVFTKKPAEALAICEFFKARQAVESFIWTPPDEDVGLWLCKSWSRVVDSFGQHVVTTTFTETYGD